MGKAKRVNGFYWVRDARDGWVVAWWRVDEYDPQGKWHFPGYEGPPYGDDAYEEIDEKRIER